jgi:hypothetical protein
MYRLMVGLDQTTAFDAQAVLAISNLISLTCGNLEDLGAGPGSIILTCRGLSTPAQRTTLTEAHDISGLVSSMTAKETRGPIDFLLDIMQQPPGLEGHLNRDITIFATKAYAHATKRQLADFQAAWDARPKYDKRLFIWAPESSGIDSIARDFENVIWLTGDASLIDYTSEIKAAIVQSVEPVEGSEEIYHPERAFTTRQMRLLSGMAEELPDLRNELSFGLGRPAVLAAGPELWEVVLIYLSGKVLDAATNQASDKVISYIVTTCKKWFKKHPEDVKELPRKYVICDERGKVLRSFEITEDDSEGHASR